VQLHRSYGLDHNDRPESAGLQLPELLEGRDNKSLGIPEEAVPDQDKQVEDGML